MNRYILLVILLASLSFRAECQIVSPKFLYSPQDTINPIGYVKANGDTSLGMTTRKYRKVDKLITKYHELTESNDTLMALKKKYKQVNDDYKRVRNINKQRNIELDEAEQALLAQKKELGSQISKLEATIVGLRIAIGLISGGAVAVITIIILILVL